jgi:hypothetical protein
MNKNLKLLTLAILITVIGKRDIAIIDGQFCAAHPTLGALPDLTALSKQPGTRILSIDDPAHLKRFE